MNNMRKKLKSILFIVFIFLIVVLSGCTKTNTDEKSRFIGKWQIESLPIYTYTFYENGTVMTSEGNITYNLTYTVQDGRLSFYMPGYPDDPLSYEYSFSDNYTKITLSLVGSPEDKFVIIKI
jgi:hypothetical protein